MPYITKQFKFCAAHKYWNPSWDEDKNYAVFGDDVKVHGHNYVLDVTITGPINQESGFSQPGYLLLPGTATGFGRLLCLGLSSHAL